MPMNTVTACSSCLFVSFCLSSHGQGVSVAELASWADVQVDEVTAFVLHFD